MEPHPCEETPKEIETEEPVKQYTKEELEDRDDNKNFYDQFDRQSPLFHAGDMTPVPIGGKLIPKSMPNEFPDGFDPDAPEPVDHSLDDPECNQMKDAIAAFKEYKKTFTFVVDALCKRKNMIITKELKDTGLMTKPLREKLNGAVAFEEEHSKNPHFTGYQKEQEAFLEYVNTLGKFSTGDKGHKIEESKLELQIFTRVLFKRGQEIMTLLKDRKKLLNDQAENN